MTKSMMIHWWNCVFLSWPNNCSQGNDALNDRVIADFPLKMQKTMILMTKRIFLVFQRSHICFRWYENVLDEYICFLTPFLFRCYECASDGCVTEDDLGIEKLCKAEAQVCFVGVGEFGREKIKDDSSNRLVSSEKKSSRIIHEKELTIIFYFVLQLTFIQKYVVIGGTNKHI